MEKEWKKIVSFFFTLLSYRDGIQADVGLRGGSDSIISGET